MSLLLITSHTRRLLDEVCIAYPYFSFFSFYHFLFTNFVLSNIGVATIKENKGKGVASVIKGEEDVLVLDDVTPLVIQKPGVQAGKRMGISSSVDLGDLPTPQGSKK